MPRSPRRYSLRSLAAVSDHSGRKIPVGFVKHNGRVAITVFPDDSHAADHGDVPASESPVDRPALFSRFVRSGRFTPIELRTIHALAFEQITLAGLARMDGCSRQAVHARLYGNSKHQGGLLKKVRRFWHELGSP